MTDEGRELVEEPEQKEFLDEDEGTPVQTPEKEVPSSTVPDACESPYNHHVENEAWG